MKREINVRQRKYNTVTQQKASGFSLSMADNARRLSLARLALNLPVYIESCAEAKAGDPRLQELTEQFYCLLAQAEEGRFLGGTEELCRRVLSLREENIRLMHVLNAYADRFTIFEYVLNRVEYRFLGGMLPEAYSDENMTQQILDSLNAVKDQTARQSLLTAVIEQLPVRMTRKRFFEIVSGGLDAYSGSDRETVDNLLFLLRTAAMLEAPIGFPAGDTVLDETVKAFEGANLQELTGDEFDRLSQMLGAAMEKLDRRMDLCMLLQELINDLTVTVILPADSLPAGDPGTARCCGVIRFMLDHIHEPAAEDELNERYASLEGIQEQAASSFQAQASTLPEYTQGCAQQLEDWGLFGRFRILEQCSRLLSASRFAALQAADSEPVTPEYLEAVSGQLIEELSASFSGRSRLLNRAVMAKLVTMLPLFLRDYSQLEEYVYSSLSACSDIAEKKGCIELIHKLISQQL